MNNSNNKSYLIINLFFIFTFILTLAIFSPFEIPQNGSFINDDITTLANIPGMSFLNHLSFSPHNFENYYGNNHNYRNTLVDLYYHIRVNTLKEKTFPKAIVGKDNWLFYTDEENMDYYQNADLFTEAELDVIQTNINSLAQQLHDQDITFLIVIAPNKETIYPQFLPPDIKKINTISKTDQFFNNLSSNTNFNAIDLRSPLNIAKQTQQVYYRTDTHWNTYGAYIAYNEIINSLSSDYPELIPYPLSQYETETIAYKGDIKKFLVVDNPIITESTIQLIPQQPPQATISIISDELLIATTNNPSLPDAVVFRDSFMTNVIPYLSEHFNNIVYKWSFQIDYDLIQKYQPDIIIYETVERYINSYTWFTNQ